MSSTQSGQAEFEELRQVARDHFWPHFQQVADFDEPDGLHVVTKGEGVWVEDVKGRKYMDAQAGMWLVNIGYGRTEVADAVYEQMRQITYAPENTTSVPTLRLVEKVASLAPDKESRVFMVSGGSEAVETALKMARKYHKIRGESGRYKYISRKGAYHGATLATASLGGSGFPEKHFGPLMPGNVHVTNPNRYRCTYCSELSDCNLECVRDVERAIEHEVPETVAAVIAEPVSAASVTVPHKDYWPTLRAICDKYGVLLIVDEVITGFGRTGRMFGTEHWNVQPDITTVAKGLSSGYCPIGATIARKDVADVFIGDQDQLFPHLITFGGNPVAAAAALANLEILENENLVDNSAKMGTYLYEQLQTLYENPIIGDIRGGLGLFYGIEIVKDKKTKEKFAPEVDIGGKLTPLFVKHRIGTRQRGDQIFLSPPLCITSDEVDYLVAQLDKVFWDLEKEVG